MAVEEKYHIMMLSEWMRVVRVQKQNIEIENVCVHFTIRLHSNASRLCGLVIMLLLVLYHLSFLSRSLTTSLHALLYLYHPFITPMPPIHWHLHLSLYHCLFLLLPPLVPHVRYGWLLCGKQLLQLPSHFPTSHHSHPPQPPPPTPSTSI